MKTVLGTIAVAATVMLFSTGCAPERPVSVGPQVATGVYGNNPTQPPPPDQKDVMPACPGPRPQWWFIPGHWEWRSQWVWVQGHWRTRPHPGDIWLSGKWVKQSDQNGQTIYVWKRGHWRSGAPADEESNELK